LGFLQLHPTIIHEDNLGAKQLAESGSFKGRSKHFEVIALCACAADVAYCRKLANELGFLQLRFTIIHEDNLGAKQLAESGSFKGRSKHFETMAISTSLCQPGHLKH
jgi:acid stress-induced BolA-like protein IbaG/YrbA